jgi:putative lipoic acid-binding regulatory protein
MTAKSQPSLLDFPCRFPIKAMGRSSKEFENTVSQIVAAHADLWPGEPLLVVPSKAGNFVSVTAVIKAQSQSQLDTIYQELTGCELVLMAL